MDLRTLLAAFGTGVTAFLVAAVLVIELLDVEFSALVGLPVGVVVGTAAFVAVLVKHDDFGDALRWAVAGLAGFGYGIFLALAASYVNLADLDFGATVGVGLVVALLAVLGSALRDRR